MAIYPEIDVKFSKTVIELNTNLRKEHEGEWYLWKFKRVYEIDLSDDYGSVGRLLETDNLIIDLHKEVYSSIILGKVINNLVDIHGIPIFEKDPDQTSEEDRLLKQYKLA